jgi:hypothetical protein
MLVCVGFRVACVGCRGPVVVVVVVVVMLESLGALVVVADAFGRVELVEKKC